MHFFEASQKTDQDRKHNMSIQQAKKFQHSLKSFYIPDVVR